MLRPHLCYSLQISSSFTIIALTQIVSSYPFPPFAFLMFRFLCLHRHYDDRLVDWIISGYCAAGGCGTTGKRCVETNILLFSLSIYFIVATLKGHYRLSQHSRLLRQSSWRKSQSHSPHGDVLVEAPLSEFSSRIDGGGLILISNKYIRRIIVRWACARRLKKWWSLLCIQTRRRMKIGEASSIV